MEANDKMAQQVEHDVRQLIGDLHMQVIVLRAALEASKPWPKGPIPKQPDVEDHPPMDWPKDKPWPPENMDRSAQKPDDDLPLNYHPEGSRPKMNGKPRTTMNG